MNIATYLEKWAGFYFSSFSRSWIAEALGGWGDGRQRFLSDLACKYPSVLPGNELGSEVCDILETDSTIEGAFLYRLARSIFLREPQHPSLRYFAHLMKVKTGMEIYYSTEIGPRFRIEHGVGIVIGPRNRIGSDFTIHQGVTLGQRRLGAPHEYATIGNHCVLFAGAKILGSVTMGDHVKIAANAVLLGGRGSGWHLRGHSRRAGQGSR